MSNRDTTPFKAYLSEVEALISSGAATEHSYRPALKKLMESLGGGDLVATNEPKRQECGAPDFIIARDIIPIGYVEAKDVGIDLDKAEKSDQLSRYYPLGNLILTDYLEFRWYQNGALRLTAHLPRPDRKGRLQYSADATSEVGQLLRSFIASDIPLQSTPQDLASSMAGIARLIRDLIRQTFEIEGKDGELHAQLEAFRHVLIESLDSDQFADMYAQTLAYGLFAARCNSIGGGFTRQIAAHALPKTNPFLRKLFNTIAGPDLDERIAWAVDQLAELLARTDIAAILEDFGSRTRREDPVVHFYETFLAAYDPKLRESRGVYYTPEPVVNYIVGAVDEILKKEFGMKDGLAHSKKIKLKRPKENDRGSETYETHRLQILDPATGTGTFLYSVIQKIRERFIGNEGAWPGYVAEHLLPRIYGFELLMAPYAVAHMKLGIELENSGAEFADDQRLQVYLTNSLDEAHELSGLPLLAQWLAEESRAASNIKRDAPVMVVLGNPPYSGESANKSKWIYQLMRGLDLTTGKKTANYFQADGKSLGERNPKWLNDDYVKFIRFAQWRISQTGYGILAFVTNHGYLDNPTFRGMRESLLRDFDDIYILDLHGNSKKKEKAPDGSKDENVFDIQQGVTIGIFVKKQKANREAEHKAVVYHHDLFGTRTAKYSALDHYTINSTPWTTLESSSPNYYLVPIDTEYGEEYESFFKITDIMPINSVGIVTARDRLTIHFSKESAWDTVRTFAQLSESEARQSYNLSKDSQDWKIHLAQKDLLSSGLKKDCIIPIYYRPYDVRYTYYTGNSKGFHCRPRHETMRHFLQRPNIALITSRLTKGEVFAHSQVTTYVPEVICMSPKTSNNGFVFPLWIYPDETDILEAESVHPEPNISDTFRTAVEGVLGANVTPEAILAYIYAVLHTPTYRERYAEFLKRDFPRIPVPPNKKLFSAMVKSGQELIELHTMDMILSRITTFEVAGTNIVDAVRWVKDGATQGKVYINDDQFFGNVPESVWEMHIGGYRVADKWLKDRKGRTLAYNDLEHYQSVIAALSRTLEIQNRLDEIIEAAGGFPLR